ncbi:DCN1-like protein 1 [Ceratobasidium theobromae]|uniref:Defective in cullin neddylation protein n=1 Tax=Ceratobasidium theobromae TaxID=1582974 RepID=A0A5N5QRQ8_9AGAM|nr:DCN1-like protein 1 [Ceratobasidium theobromae]
MPPKRKATESATERTTKTRRGGAKEAPSTKPTKSAAAAPRKGAKHENTKAVPAGLDPSTFTLEGVQALFEKYMDEDDNNVIAAEGMERLCADASIPMDGALPLLVAWIVNAKTLGTITRAEFTGAFGKLKMTLASNAQGGDPYDRTQLHSYQRNAESSYSKFYSFCFCLVKPSQSRNIDMETATAFWSVILAPKYPIASELVDFIAVSISLPPRAHDLNPSSRGKAHTRRLPEISGTWRFGQTLEFCKSVQTDLSGHDDEEAAWPSLLDDFVEWKKGKIAAQTSETMIEWPHFFTHSASLPARSVSFLKQRAATSLLNNRLHEKRVGGTWHYHLDSLGARNLTLPAIVTFASPPTIKNEYAPLSSANGYLNSRIDLKQRKRAFHPTPQSTSTSSPVALRFHEGVTLQPRGVSPSGLVDEFRKAMAQNHRLKEASITRRSRKAGRKKPVKVA